MKAELERKNKLTFDLHFVRGAREVVALTEEGRQFLRMFPIDSQFYKTAIECGLQVSFEDTELRDRFAKVQSMHD
jgi:hypothetical protein